MRIKAIKIFGIALLGAGILCNQWMLSLFFPSDGFHLSGLLEKSLGRWGLASTLLIWGFDVLCIAVGFVVLKYRSSPKKIIFTLTIVGASSILSFAVLEGIMRLVSPPNMFSPYLPLRPHNKMELRVNLREVSPVALNTTNRWGLRGDEPPERWDDFFSVVVIGGSTAQCYYLDDHKTWPYLLQEKMKSYLPKTWVGNGGISGHSTRAHIIFVREAITKMNPKAVLILTGVNDLWYSMNEEARKFGSPAEQTGWKYFVLGNSRLVQILFLWKIILFDNVVVLERSANADFVPEPLAKEMELPGNLRLLVPSLDEYRNNVHTIVADLKRLKVRTIFLTQPLLFDSSDTWKSVVGWDYSANGKKGKISAATYAKLLGIFNQELIHTCHEDSVEVFDLAAEIPHSSDYFYDTMHFNEKGAELVAEKISDYLQSHR